MAALATQSGAEPAAELYSTWTVVGQAFAWAGLSEHSEPGFSLFEHLGATPDTPLGDLGNLSQAEFDGYLEDWYVTDQAGNQARAKAVPMGRAKKAGHAMRLACGVARTFADQAAFEQLAATQQSTIDSLTAHAATLTAVQNQTPAPTPTVIMAAPPPPIRTTNFRYVTDPARNEECPTLEAHNVEPLIANYVRWEHVEPPEDEEPSGINFPVCSRSNAKARPPPSSTCASSAPIMIALGACIP